MSEKKPRFDIIRWSETHGCHFLREYDKIPPDASAVIGLKDGGFIVGKIVRGGILVDVDGQDARVRMELAGRQAAIDTSAVHVDKAERLEAEAERLQVEAQALRRRGREARLNYELAVKYAEKKTRRTRPTRKIKTS